MGAKCCFEIFNKFRLLCCLNFMPESSRCWQHFYAVFTSTETIFCPTSWRFLTHPELQQGSDWLSCNQKHFLLCYAIKINCIYINEQVASIFACNLRSDSELERHLGPAFSVTPARQTLFLAHWNFEPAAPNFEPTAPNFKPAAPNFEPVAPNFVPAH